MMDHINTSKQFLDQKYSPNTQDPTTVVPDNRRALTLEGEKSTKMVACGLSNTRSAHQNSINSSSIHNSKEKIKWTSINYTTTSRCVSMWQLDPKKNFLLLTSPSKDTHDLG